MKTRLLEFLACPDCSGRLELEPRAREGAEVMEGELTCKGCAAVYGVRAGIPRMLHGMLSDDKRKTAEAFGYQWLRFAELHDEYRDQFLDWIHPLQPEFFKDKIVLDAGCGTGRHAIFASEFGAREVIAMDLSEAVLTAFGHIGERPNVHVIQGDIYHPPFCKPIFDLVYSIGVLHHLPDPRAGFLSLVQFLRPGGSVFGWVYGYENNGFVHRFINPLRKGVTTRVPVPFVNAFAWPLAVVLVALVKTMYRPLRGTRVWGWLPLHSYVTTLSEFSFRQNHSIVFDHLVAPTAFYLRREEFAEWFRAAGLSDVELSWRNENSWRGRGRVPAVGD